MLFLVRTGKRRSDDDSASESKSDETNSRHSLSSRKRSKDRSRRSKSKSSRYRHTRSRSRRDRGSDDDFSGDDSDESDRCRSKKKRSSKNITEEEVAEYMAKKAQKKALIAAKKLKAQTVLGYSNDSNPFGDSNLNEKQGFFFPKLFVWRKKIEQDVAQGVPSDTFSVKAEKKRQKERMAEIEMVKKRREERALEKAQHEEEMALLARDRARAEFHDWEKKEEEFHFDQSKVRSEIRLREGRMKRIDGLTVKEMEELCDDIKMHLDLDRATPTHRVLGEYFVNLRPYGSHALMVVCDWELADARKKDALDRARVHGEEPPAELLAEERGLHSSIEADVKNLLEGKTHCELEALQSEIESQMLSGTAEVVEYWEAVLKRLHIFKAKACLKEIHAKMLHKHLQRLEQPSEGEDRMESDHGLTVNLDSQGYRWHDKYQPRKPKYFNRVHTGYEWNKYKQTHYDHDNPPPKIVQGYEFNIFYPDLVDKTKAPGYTIEKDGNGTETCVIRFHAGPPDEDIAFRIVNKGSEYSHKKGFKCTFEHGILHIYFNFKRYRYCR
ncbi:Cactus-binding domain, C-terminal, Cactin, central region [Theobroma cacao]|uniref:Splicing factor Cactin n=1 Tax=Theobroma cacao TaxID=3641 RepID=A0A061FKB3_THECC|nr:Cactus-binding domain, C-terminal, Cactin, central region [Theobroma cacao]